LPKLARTSVDRRRNIEIAEFHVWQYSCAHMTGWNSSIAAQRKDRYWRNDGRAFALLTAT